VAPELAEKKVLKGWSGDDEPIHIVLSLDSAYPIRRLTNILSQCPEP
jgi:hypothetical protein